MAQRPFYASREAVADRMGITSGAYANRRIDEALDAHSRIIEKKCQRPGGLFPSLRTVYHDWPDRDEPTSWRLRIAPDGLISLITLTSGGVAITGALLEPNGTGPPYSELQLNRAGSSYFGGGTSSTPQRSVAVTGVYGWSDEQRPAGQLAAAVSTTSATTITVSSAALGVLGVGDQLLIDSERLIVTDKAMTTSAQTTSGTVAADRAVTTVAVSSGTGFSAGETILIDAERMWVNDVVGNTLYVRRAWDGTPLAAHASGVTVYVPRLLTVARGASGSTAATHLIAATITRWDPPPEVRVLCAAEAVNTLQQEAAGWARQVSDGEGGAREVSARGLKDLRNQVYNTELRRKARSWTV